MAEEKNLKIPPHTSLLPRILAGAVDIQKEVDVAADQNKFQ